MRIITILTYLILVPSITTGFTNPERPEKYPGNYNLFKIDRSRDADVVMYDVNLDQNGNLDTSRPISVYWKKQTLNGRFEPLTGIQTKFGYGIKLLKVSDNMADFQLVANINQTFKLRKNSDDDFRVYLFLYGRNIEVKRLFVHFRNDSFWFPAVSRIDIIGSRPETGMLISKTVFP